MPPVSSVRTQVMLSAQMRGTVRRVLKRVKLKLTGEKLTVAKEGLPTENCHQGTKTETAIKTKVSMAASRAT